MNNLSSRSILLLIACIAVPLIVGAIGSYVTAPNISGWYSSLAKPWFTPPGWVFGPAWTVLYILMGISLWMILQHEISEPTVRQAIIFFSAQLIINLLWSVIFFGMRSPAGGLVAILVLLVLIVLTIRSFRVVSPPAAYLLIPYLCWTCFATLLTTAVVIMN